MREEKDKFQNSNTEKSQGAFFHIEADKSPRGISVCVNGVFAILDFTDELALLKLRRGKIKISGHSLEISVFENKTVEICGKISGMEFM